MVRNIIRVERKRILSNRTFIIIISLSLIFSIFKVMSLFKGYNIYDSSGNIEIKAWENLKQSKEKNNKLLDEKLLKDVINRVDKSRYLYNSNLVRLVSSNFKEKKFSEITEKDIEDFYEKRIKNINENTKKSLIKYTKEQLNFIDLEAKKLKEPIDISYAEGWKNLNNYMTDFVLVIIIVISIIIIPVFAIDQKTKMKELYESTKNGKKLLIKCRVIVSIEVGLILYITSVFIFSIIILTVFGVEGYNTQIQNSIGYFESIYNITYFQQYLLNFTLGLVAMLVAVSIVLFVTSVFNQILVGGVIVTFFWITMITIPKSIFEFHHFLGNFFPYNMTDFNSFYTNNEFYSVFGNIMFRSTVTLFISFIIFLIFTIGSIAISNKRLLKKMR